ncbi:MAG TPA: hypothetical protein VGG27_07355 [Magnetospirillaceae bacterium]
MKTSERLFGITAAHVIRDYEISKRNGRRLVVQLHEALIDIENALIAIDDDMDIATFALTEDQLALARREAFDTRPYWPPPTPKREDMVAVAGFPEIMREVRPDHSATFKAYAVFVYLSDVTKRELIVTYDPTKEDYAVTEPGPPPIDLNLSGASGGPAVLYRMFEGAASCWPVGLIAHGKGTISQGDAKAFVIVRCRRIEMIQADGTLPPKDSGWLPP